MVFQTLMRSLKRPVLLLLAACLVATVVVLALVGRQRVFQEHRQSPVKRAALPGSPDGDVCAAEDAERSTGPLIYIVNTNLSPDVQGSARRIASAITEVSGLSTMVEHYSKVTPARLTDLRPVGIVLSGQGSPWEDYRAATLQGVMDAIRETDRPLLGICGGHQLIALALGGKVDRIRRLRPGRGYEGCWKESGYVAVHVSRSDPVVGSAGRELHVYQSHYDEVKRVPSDLVILASNETCTVQAMKHRLRPLYGVQFHPECWDERHPAGRVVLQRFLRLCLDDSHSAAGPDEAMTADVGQDRTEEGVRIHAGASPSGRQRR